MFVRYTTVVNQWHSQIQDPTLADAMLDRIVHDSLRLVLKGESMRKLTSKVNVNADSIDLNSCWLIGRFIHFFVYCIISFMLRYTTSVCMIHSKLFAIFAMFRYAIFRPAEVVQIHIPFEPWCFSVSEKRLYIAMETFWSLRLKVMNDKASSDRFN